MNTYAQLQRQCLLSISELAVFDSQQRRLFFRKLALLLLMVTLGLLYGCGGGGGGSPGIELPAGLVYDASSISYVQNQPITPNTPRQSGSPITQYAVAPQLPAGLMLDPVTGIISGTPVQVSAANTYTVTGSNAHGAATAYVHIEVTAAAIPPMPPTALHYTETAVTYQVNIAIHPNLPHAEGGAVEQYAVSPALPAGLALNAETGAISGTPNTVTAAAVYTVTASNSVGSVSENLSIAVSSAPLLPPASLRYGQATAAYAQSAVIAPNLPTATGGEIAQYSVSPGLPAGLSLNTISGEITGTPSAIQAATAYTVTGSNAAGTVTATVIIAVAVGNTWTLTDLMANARVGAAAAVLPDGQVLVAGGLNQNTAELFNPVTGQWTATAAMNDMRYLATATLLQNGKVLVAGGLLTSGSSLFTAEVYDPKSRMWTPTGPMSTARASAASVLLPNGQVLIAGGASSTVAELYDPATNRWTNTAGSLTAARSRPVIVLLSNNQVLVAGGLNSSDALNTAELYNINTGTWTQTNSMRFARYAGAATLLPNGKAFVTGGSNYTAGNSVTVFENTAELFDPDTQTWSSISSMTDARSYTAATLLPNGRVLIAGGMGNGGIYLSTAELYDPDSNTWMYTPDLGYRAYLSTATLMQNGQVLITGGANSGGPQRAAAVYQP
ncbi:hypothetical protein GN109_14745 [Collimonas pratensis]|uniref:kelch repeat-containing protein n=1 Tax=Collimonas pratensis TaxID=279113 RepID=UPI00143D45A3|nr:kelch repeat-containing protein [Collimonas pratensis]NKI70683.1 hypothetical protein [Collimonas pratensis]